MRILLPGGAMLLAVIIAFGALNDGAGGAPPADIDRDGMPDEWERAHGLDPKDARDAGLAAKQGGYSNIEEYLNWLAAGKPAARK
jgi:hypothetical protein